MPFKLDTQTVSDLQLFSKNEKSASLYNFYNRTETIGGKELLYKIIRTPFAEREFLENRKADIRAFLGLEKSLHLNKRQIDFIEYYQKNRHDPLRNTFLDATRDSLMNKIKGSNDYYVIREGILHLLNLLKDLKEFLEEISMTEFPGSLSRSFFDALQYLNQKSLVKYLENIPDDFRKIKPAHVNQLDNFFRGSRKNELQNILDTVYQIDVLQSHCRLLRLEQFCLPEFSTGDDPLFEAVDCHHPLVSDSVSNSFKLDQSRSLCFITGPNMSGKSTFLKTVGILIYFAHLGLPVPAKKLTVPVLNGLFTTINLSDSISQGFSHFYAEVSRIKNLSLVLRENRNMVIILDELFRGTNVKDAYEGTLLIVNLFSKIQGTFFFISTHILEVAEHLADSQDIDFRCFESSLDQDKPVYDYKLKRGTTSERVGMQIIKNERIEEILKEIIN